MVDLEIRVLGFRIPDLERNVAILHLAIRCRTLRYFSMDTSNFGLWSIVALSNRMELDLWVSHFNLNHL